MHYHISKNKALIYLFYISFSKNVIFQFLLILSLRINFSTHFPQYQ